MKTIKIQLYNFGELSESAKERAINDNRYDILDYYWYDSVFTDALNIGLKITSFDLDRGRSIKGEAVNGAFCLAEAILKWHGEDTDTYKLAAEFMIEYKKIPETEEGYLDIGYFELKEIEQEFTGSILECYLTMLQNEFDYLTSDEEVAQRFNEEVFGENYLFTEDGKIYA